MKNQKQDQKPKIIIQYEVNPNPNFEQEFLEFTETVFSWDEERKPINNQKNLKNWIYSNS